MTFVFQQPGTAKLLEALDVASDNAEHGGGVFAFATKSGIEALLGVPRIAQMLAKGNPFHLIVGVDAITNAEALLYLRDQVGKYPGNLTAHVFYHDLPGTFHPKFSWFKRAGALHLVTGSGNLTLSGLGKVTTAALPPGNWEAFAVQAILGHKGNASLKAIEDWLETQAAAGTLRALDDENVRDRAMANARVRYVPRKPAPPPPGGPAIVVTVAPAPDALGEILVGDDVLIRELPRTRAGQADIGKKALGFLGFEGAAQDILIQYVSVNNQLDSAHEARIFVNKSKNYRLEMKPIAAIGYVPDANDNRMILVATKLDHRSFRYTVVPVTDPSYVELVALLGPIPPKHGTSRPMREKMMTATELQVGWSSAPSNLLPVFLPTSEP